MPYTDPLENARCKKQYRQKWTRWWEEYKETHPCYDCGRYFKHWQMEFDHVRGIKLRNISHFKGCDPTIKSVSEELEKCDLVCALCHSDRTYYRRILSQTVESE